MTERKLASIQRIAEIKSIPDADLICAYRINGWWVVGKKDEFIVDDLVVYIEVDSWIPTHLAPFLSKGKEPKEYMGIKGERLRTIKLKKQISQGLILGIDTIDSFLINEGDAITDYFSIIKWEAPTEFLSAAAKGNFPSFIPKTDQERIQNIPRELKAYNNQDDLWQRSEKIDGSSITIFVNAEESGVCSRNLELKEDDTNTWWKLTKQYNIIDKIKSMNRNLAIQGEIYGSSINGNLYNLTDQRLMVYNIYDIDNNEYLNPEEALNICIEYSIPHVPVINNTNIKGTMQDFIDKADGNSIINPLCIKEGDV